MNKIHSIQDKLSNITKILDSIDTLKTTLSQHTKNIQQYHNEHINPSVPYNPTHTSFTFSSMPKPLHDTHAIEDDKQSYPSKEIETKKDDTYLSLSLMNI